EVTNESKIWSVVAHLSYLLAGVGFIIIPGIIMMLKKEDRFVYYHAKQAFTAQVVVSLFSVLAVSTGYLILGMFALPFVFVFVLVLFVSSVIAGIRAAKGQLFDYPFMKKIME
ncbi:DUF4870 domain-containing protein, partial [Selenomonadales bacterium OttesenSCG-928-I06]|nr:DUF4870 domain-containing protein [Selenomonadales bacterium OttesenSCG-928-I06]